MKIKDELERQREQDEIKETRTLLLRILYERKAGPDALPPDSIVFTTTREGFSDE